MLSAALGFQRAVTLCGGLTMAGFFISLII
jgi:hypothetical protein